MLISNLTDYNKENEGAQHNPTETVTSWTGSIDSEYEGNHNTNYPPVGLGHWED